MRVVELPFPYQVATVPYRRQAEVSAIVRDVAQFHLAEPSDADAPIVFVREHRQQFEERKAASADMSEFRRVAYPWLARPKLQIETLRRFEGRLYTQVVDHAGEPVAADRFLSDIAQPSRHFHQPILGAPDPVLCCWSARDLFPSFPVIASRDRIDSPMHLPGRSEWLARALSKFPRPNRPRRVSDDRAMRLVEAADVYAKGLFLFDGGVWTSRDIAEPRYEVSYYDGSASVYVRMRPLLPGDNGVPFSIADRGLAVEFATLLARRGGVRTRITADVVGASPGTTPTSTKVWIGRAARAVVEGLGKRTMFNYEPPSAQEAADVLMESLKSDDDAAVIEAGARFVDAIGELRVRGDGPAARTRDRLSTLLESCGQRLELTEDVEAIAGGFAP